MADEPSASQAQADGDTDFQGDVAVITGGARGIGRAIAQRLAFGGATVTILDSDAEAASDEAARIGGRSIAVDVTNADLVQQAIGHAAEANGTISILVNNAGVAGRSVPAWELEITEWERVLAVNLSGAFYCSRAVIPYMRQHRYGRIVNISSIAGKEGNPNAVPYSASKAGMIGLSKALAKEVLQDGILINCVTPGMIETELLQQMSEQHRQYMLSKIPLGRAGRPEEVAELVAWLCSRRCSFSTGAVFDISGGRATY